MGAFPRARNRLYRIDLIACIRRFSFNQPLNTYSRVRNEHTIDKFPHSSLTRNLSRWLTMLTEDCLRSWASIYRCWLKISMARYHGCAIAAFAPPLYNFNCTNRRRDSTIRPFVSNRPWISCEDSRTRTVKNYKHRIIKMSNKPFSVWRG